VPDAGAAAAGAAGGTTLASTEQTSPDELKLQPVAIKSQAKRTQKM
jgi:hypothetical protein